MNKYNVGNIILGRITGIKPYGAFVNVDDEYTGLVHISEISDNFVRNIEDFVSVNEQINLKIIEIDLATKHMKLSLKSASESKRSSRRYMQFSKDYRKDIANFKQDFNEVSAIVSNTINDLEKAKVITVNLEYCKDYNPDKYSNKVKQIHNHLNDKNKAREESFGWVNQPNEITKSEIDTIYDFASEIRNRHNVFVVCGIGGSYLGARAGIEMLNGFKKDNKIEIIYFGYNLSSHYINQTLDYLKGKDFVVNVISKSGTTLESAIGFRLLRNLLIQKYGEPNANNRIIITTDSENGLLRKAVIDKKYVSFTIPKDIGGRYSVLTSVGLLPFAVAGIDICELIKGAKKAYFDLSSDLIEENEAYKYAIARLSQYENGKSVELLLTYEPQLMYLAEWWKQLFAESEGKSKKGLFTAAISNPTDLHSLGQFIQEGSPILFETVININPIVKEIILHELEDDFDQLNYLKNQTLSSINQMVLKSTINAHFKEGNVSNIVININRYDAFGLGYLFYFFMKSCAMSSYLLGVNPFNQPGVEVYKRNLFDLLGKKAI